MGLRKKEPGQFLRGKTSRNVLDVWGSSSTITDQIDLK